MTHRPLPRPLSQRERGAPAAPAAPLPLPLGGGWGEGSGGPPKRSEFPTIKNSEWAKNAIDHFVLARLEREGIQPSSVAVRPTLIRRVTFDLIMAALWCPVWSMMRSVFAPRSAALVTKLARRLWPPKSAGSRPIVSTSSRSVRAELRSFTWTVLMSQPQVVPPSAGSKPVFGHTANTATSRPRPRPSKSTRPKRSGVRSWCV